MEAMIIFGVFAFIMFILIDDSTNIPACYVWWEDEF